MHKMRKHRQDASRNECVCTLYVAPEKSLTAGHTATCTEHKECQLNVDCLTGCATSPATGRLISTLYHRTVGIT